MSEAKAAIDVDGLQALIGALATRGYKVLGPTVRDGAIVYDEIEGVADLPAGWTDGQDAGRYRLERREDDALFGFAHGPQSWKRYLHPPMQTLWTAKRNGDGLKIVPPDPPTQKFAFIGARSCELHAIAVQDKVFQDGPFVDMAYAARRRGAFIVAVNCAEAGGTCFCVSMKTGPKAETGFDLALTEILSENSHTFLIEAGSEPGAELLAQLPKRPATSDDL
ncbi:MAG: sulfite reductase subunit A, partial [Rhodomicrobium sp.]